MCITIYGSNNIQHTMAQDNKPKITFADLDNFLKIAPIIGLAILAYLQTLFPSKTEFKEIGFNRRKFREAYSKGYKKLYKKASKQNLRLAFEYYKSGFRKSIKEFFQTLFSYFKYSPF